MAPIRRRLYVVLERLADKFSDALIVVAARDIKKGLEQGIGQPSKYHLIRSAIPLDVFSHNEKNREKTRKMLGIPLDAIVMGNVGRLSHQKNPLDWIRVAKGVSEAVPECHFVLVGDGPLRDEVQSKAKSLKISDRLILTGLRRDVPEMLSAMDLFLITSLWEGLPRVIPQAFAMKLPVVANIADGTIEAIEHGVTGYLCKPGDIQQMTEFCVNLLKDPEQRQKMGERGQSFVLKEFDLRTMITQIEELYQELLQEKGLLI
jgi:glycosyltransferase involved in cell wall biosynthesis